MVSSAWRPTDARESDARPRVTGPRGVGEGPRVFAVREITNYWCEKFNPPENLVNSLNGDNLANFHGAFAELRTAATLEALGFQVDMRPKFGKLTPDIKATKDGHSLLVEVFSLGSDGETQRKALKLESYRLQLMKLLDLPPDIFIALSTYGEIPESLTDETIITLAAAIQGAAEEHASSGTHWTDLQAREFELSLTGSIMIGPHESTISLHPSGMIMSEGPRLGKKIADKVKKYSTIDHPLTIAINSHSWPIDHYDILASMLGQRVLALGEFQQVNLSYSGDGLLSVLDETSTQNLSGIWSIQGHLNEEPTRDVVEVSFFHNPTTGRPLAHGLVEGIDEWRHNGVEMFHFRPMRISRINLGVPTTKP